MKSVFVLAASLAALTYDKFVSGVMLGESNVQEADMLLGNLNAISLDSEKSRKAKKAAKKAKKAA